jgi:PAS domain S-box-containing protein
MAARYHRRMPFFICPNCKQRSIDADGLQGLTHQAVACDRCGFGFLFELMDDYYPAPNSGFVVCDRSGRVIAVGRGVFELTGYREADLIGQDVSTALALSDTEPLALVQEWGVRRLGQELELRTRAGLVKPVLVDLFPAYDEDGGVLVALSSR